MLSGMMTAKPSTDTRKAILKRAERYLQDAGFASFSFRTLASDLGIKSASVHYHFPSKEELGVTLLQGYREQFEKWTASRENGGSPRADLIEWFEFWRALSRGGNICPGGAFGTEFTALPKRVRLALEKLQDAERRWLCTTLKAGRKLGQVRTDGKVGDQAELVLATLQGGLQIARVGDNPKGFDGVLEQLKITLFA